MRISEQEVYEAVNYRWQSIREIRNKIAKERGKENYNVAVAPILIHAYRLVDQGFLEVNDCENCRYLFQGELCNWYLPASLPIRNILNREERLYLLEEKMKASSDTAISQELIRQQIQIEKLQQILYAHIDYHKKKSKIKFTGGIDR